MIDDGLFTRFAVDEVYALHNWPALEPGYIGLNPGPMMAAADRLHSRYWTSCSGLPSAYWPDFRSPTRSFRGSVVLSIFMGTPS
jgi:hypothetical protein